MSTSCRARSTSPLWLMPASAMTKHGWSCPIRRSVSARTRSEYGLSDIAGRLATRAQDPLEQLGVLGLVELERTPPVHLVDDDAAAEAVAVAAQDLRPE